MFIHKGANYVIDMRTLIIRRTQSTKYLLARSHVGRLSHVCYLGFLITPPTKANKFIDMRTLTIRRTWSTIANIFVSKAQLGYFGVLITPT
jgi:hypothetical protein